MRWVQLVTHCLSLKFRIFTAPLLITFLSPDIATSFNIHIPCFIITNYNIRFIIIIVIVIINVKVVVVDKLRGKYLFSPPTTTITSNLTGNVQFLKPNIRAVNGAMLFFLIL